jgi:hypothetical protein
MKLAAADFKDPAERICEAQAKTLADDRDEGIGVS